MDTRSTQRGLSVDDRIALELGTLLIRLHKSQYLIDQYVDNTTKDIYETGQTSPAKYQEKAASGVGNAFGLVTTSRNPLHRDG